MIFKPVKSRKLSDQIAEQLRQQIIRGRFPVGHKLPREKALIDQLGASRGTVREALKALESQGLIANLRGADGGARVIAVPPERALELLANYFHFNPVTPAQIYQMRRIVEPEIAAAVTGHLTSGQIAELERLIDLQAQEPTNPKGWERQRKAEVDFHDVLAAACPNPLLALTARFINKIIRGAIESVNLLAAQESNAFSKACTGHHRKIVEVLLGNDPDLSRKVMYEHVVEAERYVKRIYEKLALAGRPLPSITFA